MIDEYTRPDFKAAALVTIDVQQDFLDGGPCEVSGTTAVLPRIHELLEAFRVASKPIIHVVRIYTADGCDVDLCRRAIVRAGKPIARPGTAGMQLADRLVVSGVSGLDWEALLRGELQKLRLREWAMYKPRWGAFYRTRLETFLHALSVTTLVFTGCNFPNCPRTSIYEASERDFRVVLVADAVSGFFDRGRGELEDIGVAVMSTMEILAELRVQSQR
jgi:nicotinamidase-related amidase